MTKKHFIALADHVRYTGHFCEPFSQKQLAYLADFCQSQNHSFNRQRWLDYIAEIWSVV